MLWIAALAAMHAQPLQHELTGVWLAFPLVGVGLATAAAMVAIAAMVVDLTLLGMLAGQAITAPATLTPLSGFGPMAPQQ